MSVLCAKCGILVERGIPLPVKYHSGRIPKYPFHEMQVGDSFEFKVERRTMNDSARMHGRRYGKKFTVRSITRDTVRVWRIR